MKKNLKVVAAVLATPRVEKVREKARQLGQEPAARLEADLERTRLAVIATMKSGHRPRGGLYRPTLRRALDI